MVEGFVGPFPSSTVLFLIMFASSSWCLLPELISMKSWHLSQQRPHITPWFHYFPFSRRPESRYFFHFRDKYNYELHLIVKTLWSWSAFIHTTQGITAKFKEEILGDLTLCYAKLRYSDLFTTWIFELSLTIYIIKAITSLSAILSSTSDHW